VTSSRHCIDGIEEADMEPRINAQIVALRQAELAAGARRPERRGPRLVTTFRAAGRRAPEGS
jgi:hypothetical protein